MKPMHRNLAAALLLALAAAPAVQAQDWFVRAGATVVDPKSDTGSLAGGALKADIDSQVALGLTLGYHFTPNWALELLASSPFEHNVKLNGAKAADFEHLPPTLSLQYYFRPEARMSPFLGAGVNFTWTFDEDGRGPLAGADVGIENSWGPAVQGGLRVKLQDNWDLVADVRWIDIDADVDVGGAKVGTAHVDPLVYSVLLGYRF